MNEGIGSTTTLVIIVVFIAFASSYMAFNVNYTKAFRMKNKIIALYEEYNGQCGSECQRKIVEYAKSIGYNPSNSLNCSKTDINPIGNTTPSGTNKLGYYCEYKIAVDKSAAKYDAINDSKPQHYYRILTRINIRIPIIENVLNLKALNITGDTKAFTDN